MPSSKLKLTDQMSLKLVFNIFKPIIWILTLRYNHGTTLIFDMTLAWSWKCTSCAIKFFWRTKRVITTLFLWRWCLINIVILIFDIEKFISCLLWRCQFSFFIEKFLMHFVCVFDVIMIFKHQIFCL